MDFALTDRQQELRERLEAFCTEHCTEEAAAALDREPVYPEALHRALADSGLLRYCLPARFGGEDGGALDLVLINEVLGAHSSAAANILFVNLICALLLTFAGSDEQKNTLVTAIGKGDERFAFALTEPEAGSDAGAIRTTARADGGEYRLDGVKLYATGAEKADYIVTAVRTDTEAKPSRGISLFVVPTGTPGLDIEPLDKIAGNAVSSCRVTYDGVRVSKDTLLGMENGAWPILMLGGGLERVIVAASAVGGAQSALDEMLRFAGEREQFGQPIGRFQAIQHQLADVATEIEAARLLVYRAAWLIDQGKQPVKEVSMAKLYASERLCEILMRGMRLLGGSAYLTETPMPRRLREAMLSLYAGGTAEIQRNLIARHLGL